MDLYSKALESFLIPAEEGLLFSSTEDENLDKLKENKSLVVFTTENTFDFGGINVNKYTKIANKSRAVSICLDDCVNLFGISKNYKYPLELENEIKSIKSTDKDNRYDQFDKIILACDKVSKKNNILVVIVTTESQYYGSNIIRDHPVAIVSGSMAKAFLSRSKRAITNNATYVKEKSKEYERMDLNIPKELFVKNRNFELFHVSPNSNITELQPRITTKRLYDENIRIPRVSAAPSIDACFRAVGLTLNKNDKPKRYYVYQLMIEKDTRIVKPSVKLVPDQQFTNEYWILDPIKVECLGYITVSLDKKTKNLKFDDSTISRDPMVTTTFYHD